MSFQSLLIVLALTAASLGVAQAQVAAVEPASVPGHPTELQFGELEFEVPDGEAYRHTLSNGVVVYIVEDHQLPLVNVTVTARLGSFLDPEDRPGLAETTGNMLRRGGTKTLSAEEFDERVEFLAAEIESSTASTRGTASLNCITQVLEESLGLFFDMLKTPGFQEDRLTLEKDQVLEAMKQRNDQPQAISRRNWQWLMRGMDSYLARELTANDITAITRDDLVRFHSQYWRPPNLILGISGDVVESEILAALESHFAEWQTDGPEVPWPPPAPSQTPEPGVYHLQKDIPQGRVLIGHLGYQRPDWGDPDVHALVLMNEILGGGGFTSRLLKRIRSDEGLAYSAFSQFGVDLWWPGIFTMGYQSKSSTVALAATIALEELERIRSEAVSAEELATAKASLIDVFPRQFESAHQTVGLFVRDEFEGRPHSYWTTYRDQVRSITEQDVLRVARDHLHPDRLVYLIVGDWPVIEAGDPDGRASMQQIFGGESTALPLRDPLTLEPMPD
jgi:zinc protease